MKPRRHRGSGRRRGFLDVLHTSENELLRRGRRAGQRVSQVQHDHVHVRVSWGAGSDEPRGAGEVGVLGHESQGSVLRILPEGICESDRTFLDGSVLAVGTAVEAIADEAAVIWSRDGIALDVDSAVVGVQQEVLVREFETVNCRA